MFEAFVLICLMGDIKTEQCIEAKDTYGPYATQSECIKRANGMVSQLIEMEDMPLKPAAFRCTKIKGEFLKT